MGLLDKLKASQEAHNQKYKERFDAIKSTHQEKMAAIEIDRENNNQMLKEGLDKWEEAKKSFKQGSKQNWENLKSNLKQDFKKK